MFIPIFSFLQSMIFIHLHPAQASNDWLIIIMQAFSTWPQSDLQGRAQAPPAKSVQLKAWQTTTTPLCNHHG
jgi:hypothetical protein